MQPTKKLISLALLAQFAVSAFAGPFTPGNIVVSRIGDGTATLTSAATAVFLDEYTPTGTLVQTVPMPTTLDGNNRILTNSGSAASEGMLSRSDNKAGLVLVGYDAAVGTASVVSTTVLTVNRIVGFVKADGTVDTSTNITDAYDVNNIRSAASVDGTSFWTAGTAPGTGGGVRWIPNGPAQVSQLISTNVTNTRVVRIFNGQLYVSTGSGAFKGVNAVGTGLPTTNGQTITLLPGFDPNTTSTASPYEFAFADANTLYVADDRASTSGGGIQKWTFDGTVWNLQYTIASGTFNGGARGLAVMPDAGGNILYTTTNEAAANNLMKAVDTGAGTTFSVIATAAPFTRFRGLAFSPEETTTSETLAPGSEGINLGKGTAGNLASWADDDANARRICKFIVPSLSSPFIRVGLNYTTTKTTPTAIDFIVMAKMVHGGAFKIRLFVQNKVSSVFDQVLADTTINLTGATYTGSAAGTLTNYVGGGGAMTGRIEIQQTGPAAVTLPCTDFEFANMKVTG